MIAETESPPDDRTLPDISNQSEKCPILWSTSRRSGALFQGPLLTALNLEGRALAVTAKASPIRPKLASEGQLLGDVSTAVGIKSAALLPFECWGDRRQLRQSLERRASVIHITMMAPWDIFYIRAAQGLNIPIVATIHDAQRHPGDESAMLDLVDRAITAKVDHLVCFSKFVRDSFQASGQMTVPVHLIEGGLLTRAEPQVEPRPAVKGRIPRLLFLGRIQPYKGLDLLVEALLQLQQSGLEFQLTVAGAGDLAPQVGRLRLLRNLELINRWISDEEVTTLLKDSDVMVMPYIEASQSGVAIDALWAGLPTVATPVGALPQQFCDGKDAIITGEVSADAVGGALTRILTDEELYVRLSRGAYESFQAIGIRPVAEMWRSFYSEIAR